MNGSTIEITHSDLIAKINIVGKCINYINKHSICKDNTKLIRLTNIHTVLKSSYEIDVVGILSAYYANYKEDIVDTYNIYIAGNDVVGKLSTCINYIEQIAEESKPQTLINNIRKFRQSTIITEIKDVAYDICHCGATMTVFPAASEIVCISCGNVLTLHGTVFEDIQFYNQEGKRSKHGSYDMTRHCKFWVDRIQAIETADIPKKVLDTVITAIKRDGIVDCRKLLCVHIRKYLKEVKHTEYNDHIPLIRKLITGLAPPQLTRIELNTVYNIFNKSITIFDIVKSPEKSNTPYYPYILYKILEYKLKPGIRKKKILECIHLQSRDTLIANDNIWETICKDLTDIKYKPTDRNTQGIDI